MAKPRDNNNSSTKSFAGILKKYNAQVISWDKSELKSTESRDTGILSLNMALGVGGLAKGIVVEFSGEPSMGKTLMALKIIRTAQEKYGERSYFDDVECATPKSWLVKQSIKLEFLDRLEEKEPDKDTGEIPNPLFADERLEILEEAILHGKYAYAVVDSVPSLMTRDQYETTAGEDQRPGGLSKLLTERLPRLVHACAYTGTTVIFINQMRDKFGGANWGPKRKTTPGGMALKHFCSVRVEVNRAAGSTEKDESGRPFQHAAVARIIKNKLAAPQREAQFTVNYSKGIMGGEGQLFEFAVSEGILIRAGAYYNFADTFARGAELGRIKGRENIEVLIQSDDILREQLLEHLALSVQDGSSAVPVEGSTEEDDASLSDSE